MLVTVLPKFWRQFMQSRHWSGYSWVPTPNKVLSLFFYSRTNLSSLSKISISSTMPQFKTRTFSKINTICKISITCYPILSKVLMHVQSLNSEELGWRCSDPPSWQGIGKHCLGHISGTDDPFPLYVVTRALLCPYCVYQNYFLIFFWQNRIYRNSLLCSKSVVEKLFQNLPTFFFYTHVLYKSL